MNLSRTVRDLRVHDLTTAQADELACAIEKMHEALKWYASADYGQGCRADVSVRWRAVAALKGIE